MALITRASLSAGTRTSRLNFQCCSRRYADLTVTKNLKGEAKPIISYGSPGRSATTGHVATVFGASGQLGGYIVTKLARQGTQVILPNRDSYSIRHLWLTGDLGAIVPMDLDLRNTTQIEEAVRHSDIVYNCLGRDYSTKNFTMEDVNVKAAENIAKISADNGVSRLVHLSHINASPDSLSEFYRTKYAGEVATRNVFPGATVIRPSVFFGRKDSLLKGLSVNPSLYKINYGQTKVRPVHVTDVALAATRMMTAHSSIGSTYLLPGPRTYTYDDISKLVDSSLMREPSFTSTNKNLLLLKAKLTKYLWWHEITEDEILKLTLDDFSEFDERQLFRYGDKLAGDKLKSWEEIDIDPAYIEDWIVPYTAWRKIEQAHGIPMEGGSMHTSQSRKPYRVLE